MIRGQTRTISEVVRRWTRMRTQWGRHAWSLCESPSFCNLFGHWLDEAENKSSLVEHSGASASEMSGSSHKSESLSLLILVEFQRLSWSNYLSGDSFLWGIHKFLSSRSGRHKFQRPMIFPLSFRCATWYGGRQALSRICFCLAGQELSLK